MSIRRKQSAQLRKKKRTRVGRTTKQPVLKRGGSRFCAETCDPLFTLKAGKHWTEMSDDDKTLKKKMTYSLCKRLCKDRYVKSKVLESLENLRDDSAGQISALRTPSSPKKTGRTLSFGINKSDSDYLEGKRTEYQKEVQSQLDAALQEESEIRSLGISENSAEFKGSPLDLVLQRQKQIRNKLDKSNHNDYKLSWGEWLKGKRGLKITQDGGRFSKSRRSQSRGRRRRKQMTKSRKRAIKYRRTSLT